jgi:hypothetical protein
MKLYRPGKILGIEQRTWLWYCIALLLVVPLLVFGVNSLIEYESKTADAVQKKIDVRIAEVKASTQADTKNSVR